MHPVKRGYFKGTQATKVNANPLTLKVLISF